MPFCTLHTSAVMLLVRYRLSDKPRSQVPNSATDYKGRSIESGRLRSQCFPFGVISRSIGSLKALNCTEAGEGALKSQLI